MKNILTQPNIHFRNAKTGVLFDNLWGELHNGLWKNIQPENILSNALLEGVDRTSEKPILKETYLISKGMKWDSINKRRYDPIFIPEVKKVTLEIFLAESYRFFNQFKEKKIGVQLSGGFDSSLIIGLLKYFNIPFSLVGLANNRFEFRTESHIQNTLAEWGDKVFLIDYETCLPYSNIENVPPHQYPEEYIRTFGPDFEMAKKAKELGIEVLLTGQGGDNVFGDKIDSNPASLKWMPHTYRDIWLEDLVYKPMGVELIPFYGDEKISEMIFNLRIGQKADIPKVWARHFFKDFLPKELVNYTYHSDFWGFIISGVSEVIPKLPYLFEQTYDLTQNCYFNKEKVNQLMKIDLLDHKKETYMQIEPLLGIAVWIDTLVKADIIKK